MTRDEHLAWAKARATEYVNTGDWSGAVASMLSDLGKHPDLRGAQATAGLLMQTVEDVPSARRFVEGFN